MILSESEVKERYESPNNLLNRLRDSLESKSNIISLPPKAEDIIVDLEDKLAAVNIKTKAAAIMNVCLNELEARASEITKPEKLSAIAVEMNKIIHVQDLGKKEKDSENSPQYHIYAPTFVKEDHFETIYVKE